MQIDNEDDIEEFPIGYSIDNLILMHRDAHFGGDFDLMLQYYEKNGRGALKDLEIERIKELQTLEKTTGKNLSAVMLSGAEAEKVARTRQLYQQLQGLYEMRQKKSSIPVLIADLILAEEDETDAAAQAVVAEKGAIVPALIELLRNEEFYDPLSPGYGQAPTLAAKCLGLIGDKRAIISLFEAIGEGDFFNEDMILEALHVIGDPARDFLLKVVHGRPLTGDNEKAAIALVAFKNDPVVSDACLNMLKEIDLVKDASLATYLVLACEGLDTSAKRKELLALAERRGTPKPLQLDIHTVAKEW